LAPPPLNTIASPPAIAQSFRLTNPTEQQHKIEQAPTPVESGMKMSRATIQNGNR
jgi:hypothetical protein